MRILVATTGSDGDVQPFLALAQRLMKAGHDVRIATSDNYAPRASALGVPFVAVGPPWNAEEVRGNFEKILALKAPLKQLALVVEAIEKSQRAAVADLLPLAAAVDVVVYQPIFVAAVAAARKAGTRHVSVHLAPLHRASGYGPTGSNLGSALNTFGWWLAGGVLRRATDARLNTIVLAAGLPPWRDVLLSASHSPTLDLIAASPHVIPKDPSWPATTEVTGYFFVDDAPFAPDPALLAFLNRDPAKKPVVIGFGSMIGFDPKARTNVVLDAARGIDRGVVIQSGWAGLGDAKLPDNVHVTGFAPHAWLFERAACVVHHGGAGTTAAAFRAGIPQTVVWHLGDQPLWAKKTEDLGVGPRARFYEKLDAPWLKESITRMLDDGAMIASAQKLGDVIRGEDGLGVAARAIGALT